MQTEEIKGHRVIIMFIKFIPLKSQNMAHYKYIYNVITSLIKFF
jgi:hypothetical protein